MKKMHVLGFAVFGWMIPIALAVGLFVGGFIIWAATNVLSITLHSVDFPNLDYWESFWVFGALWIVSRVLQDHAR